MTRWVIRSQNFRSKGTILILPHLISGWQMNLNVKRILPFAIFLSGAAQLVPQTLATSTLIKAGRLLDPRSGNVLSPAAVLIENGKIKEVGAPANVTIIDLDSARTNSFRDEKTARSSATNLLRIET